MNVLITGGAGFLGLHLANFLEKKCRKLTLVDIAPFAEDEYPGNYRLVQGDVRNEELMLRLAQNQDVIIHAAAALPLWKRKEIFDININGTRNILSAAQENTIKRLIYISSTAVYGIPHKHPVYETDPLSGIGPYGESKIEAEKLCFAAIKNGFPVTILRPKTFVGSHRLGVFEILFDWIHDNKKIPVIGNGQNRYQLLDVEDLVEAIYLFMQKDKPSFNDVFNVGALEFRTVKQDLKDLIAAASSSSTILPTPAFPVKKALWLFEKLKLSPLYQWVYDTADKDSFVSIEKLAHVLVWKPRRSNSQALIKAYNWYRKNYDKIKTKKSGVTHNVGWKQGILGILKKFL